MLRLFLVLTLALAAAGLAGCRAVGDPDRGPLVLDLTVTATGLLTDTATYGIVLSGGDRNERIDQRIAYGGGHVVITRFPPGARWVALELPASCWLDGQSPVPFDDRQERPIPVAFATSCFGPPASVLSPSTIPVGTEPSRLVLGPGQRFTFQVIARGRIWQTLGSYAYEGSRLRFDFDAAPGEWNAIGTVIGRCLELDVNFEMELSDFADAAYCGDGLQVGLRVTAPTTGADPDSAYLVRLDGTGGHVLAANDALALDLSPGEHVIELADIAGNCSVDGPNPIHVAVTIGARAEVAFPVTCVPRASQGIDVTITTVGTDPDDRYVLTFCTVEQWDCIGPEYSEVVEANATVQVHLAAGQHYAWLDDVARNCSVQWTSSDALIVAAGRRKPLGIEVTCLGQAAFAATVTTTGADRQEQFHLTVDGLWVAWLPADSTVTASVVEGGHAIGLASIQENCRATSPNPVPVTLVPGVLTPVRFAIDCQPFAVLEVAVSTSGSNLPPGFVVGLDPDLIEGGYAYSTAIGSNGTATMKLNLGAHAVWLDQVPANCAVDGANPVTVDAQLGATLAAAFAVTCR